MFYTSFDKFCIRSGVAIQISIEETGKPTTKAGSLSSMVFAKMCAHARSIGAIVEFGMFDHSAIMSITRMIIEACTMIGYLSEDVDSDTWEFRHLVIRLHDTVNRIKLLRGYPGEHDISDLKAGKAQLIESLKTHKSFSELNKDQQNGLLSGEQIFVGGMRRVAKASLGWHEDRFTAIYSYLSAHSHSSPMSFSRMREHNIDYLNPSDQQYHAATLSIEIATACISRTVRKMFDRNKDIKNHINAAVIDDIVADDAVCDVF